MRLCLRPTSVSQDCLLGETTFDKLNRPQQIDGQRVSALRYTDEKVHTLLSVLLIFRLLPRGFSNRDLREHWAPLLGQTPQSITPGQMTYHLRRLRLHGLIERQAETHRYRVTEQGLRIAIIYTRSQQRLFRPATAGMQTTGHPLAEEFARHEKVIDGWIADQLAAA